MYKSEKSFGVAANVISTFKLSKFKVVGVIWWIVRPSSSNGRILLAQMASKVSSNPYTKIQMNRRVTACERIMVLLKELWLFGCITQIFTRKDKIIHIVLIKTIKGKFRRPVCKICRLPVEQQSDLGSKWKILCWRAQHDG